MGLRCQDGTSIESASHRGHFCAQLHFVSAEASRSTNPPHLEPMVMVSGACSVNLFVTAGFSFLVGGGHCFGDGRSGLLAQRILGPP